MKQPLLMHINNSVFLRDNVLVMIDRRLLPGQTIEVAAHNYEEVAEAIENMVVQGRETLPLRPDMVLAFTSR
ncbi:MAG TPA: hypothetical protein DD811_10075 [Syntrophomonas sp.]|nr:hypothetical protein [Syntrophomonas sp.]